MDIGFRKRSCSANNLKRDDDSKKSRRALGPRAPHRSDARDQELVDPAAVEIDHLEAPALDVDRLADFRQMAGFCEHKSRDRLEIPLRWELEMQPLGQLVRLHRAGDEERAVGALDDAGLTLSF